MMTRPKENYKLDWRYLKIKNRIYTDIVVIKRIFNHNMDGETIGRPISIKTWRKYALAMQSNKLLTTLASYNDDQWDAFLMMEAIDNDGLTI
jgi:hypothetical protein